MGLLFLFLFIFLLLLTGHAIASKKNGTTPATASPSLAFINTLAQADKAVPVFSESYVQIGRHKLHYVSAGSGQLVIFYHGFPSYWYSWKPQMLELAKHYRVVAVDGLGANLSDKPALAEAYKINQLAQQLDLFINAIKGPEAPVLVAHDWGGALAWAYAQHHPKTLKKLIVLSAPPFNLYLDLLQNNADQQQASTYVERLKALNKPAKLDPSYATELWRVGYSKLIETNAISAAEGQLFKQALSQPGALKGGINWYQANIPAAGAITEADYWPSRAASTSTSTDSLLIWGEKDEAFVADFLRRLPQYASKLRIETLPNVGHWPALEAPNQVNQLIQDFIESATITEP